MGLKVRPHQIAIHLKFGVKEIEELLNLCSKISNGVTVQLIFIYAFKSYFSHDADN